jgi:RND family efflux transporter MFP subunit
VNLSTPIAEVSRTNELEIAVFIAERFISRVQVGLQAIVRLDAFPGETFSASVTELSPVVDPLTRTLEVTLRFDESDRRVRSGMFAEVRIVTEQKEGVVKVPADVLIRRFGDSFVFVVSDDGTVQRRSVTPGIEIDNVLEIVSGLEPDERVVYQGQALLADGAAVRVVDTISPLIETADQR